MKCDKCGSEVKEIGRERKMAELEEGASEGQAADYMAAELAGENWAWGVTEISYKCGDCGNILVVIED